MDYKEYYFIRKYYKGSLYPIDEMVEDTDVDKVEDDGLLAGFSFYKSETWIFDDGYWIHSTSDFTGRIWYGKRYSYDEFKDFIRHLSIKEILEQIKRSFKLETTYLDALKTMKQYDFDYICVDRFGYTHYMEKDDITYEELNAKNAIK